MPQDKRPLAPQFLAMSRQERDLLYKLYVQQNKTAEQLASKFGFSVRFVYTRLKEHGITKEGYTKPQLTYCPTCGQRWVKRRKKKST
jgi:hypothetical protein